MNDKELERLVYDVFFEQWGERGIPAKRELREMGLEVLKPLLLGLIAYIKQMTRQGKSPLKYQATPSNQLLSGYLRPIFNIFIDWSIDFGHEPEYEEIKIKPILDALRKIIDETGYPNLRIVAVLALSQLIVISRDEPKGIYLLKQEIGKLVSDDDPIIGITAMFVEDWLIFFEDQTIIFKDPDLRKRSELNAMLIIESIASL